MTPEKSTAWLTDTSPRPSICRRLHLDLGEVQERVARMDEALSQHRRRRHEESEVLQLFKLEGFEPGEAIERSRKLGAVTTR